MSKWKPGDPPPKRSDYESNAEYEADDTKYRQWKMDSQRDSAGGVTDTKPVAPKPGVEIGVDPNTRRQYRRTVVGAPVIVEQGGAGEAAKRKSKAEAEPDAEPSPKPDGDEEPKREDFPAGLGGASDYNKALAEYKKRKKVSMGPSSPYPMG